MKWCRPTNFRLALAVTMPNRKSCNKLSSTSIDMVRHDVLPYVINPQELDIWSNEYFLQLADMMIVQ